MQQHMLKFWLDWVASAIARLLPSGHFIAYENATASGHYAAAARLLHIVLFTKRLVNLNHLKLIAMINVIEKYSNERLDLSINTDQPYVAFYGSSQESQKSTKGREKLR
ncbi:hypothetical protein BD408DRAFT_444037 [Parasitella parasitica]|nr:hypothetical protein BD408DRAFT_444037 [Parasitella parasitica]